VALGVKVAEGIGVWVAVGGTGVRVGVTLGVRLGLEVAVGGTRVEVGRGLSVGAAVGVGWQAVASRTINPKKINKGECKTCLRRCFFDRWLDGNWGTGKIFRLKMKP
jgi:hypothetical protein